MQIVRVETDLPYTELAGIFGYASDVTMRRSLAQGLDAVEADPGATDLLLTAQRILR